MAQTASKSVRLRPDTVESLHERKQFGDSYDDVVRRLLSQTAEADAEADAEEN